MNNKTNTITLTVYLHKSCGALAKFEQKSCQQVQPAKILFNLINKIKKQRYKVVSDENGMVKVDLPPGDYQIISHKFFRVSPAKIAVSAAQHAFTLHFYPMIK